MTSIEIFRFPATGQEIRMLVRDGVLLFCHTDICFGLEHSNPSVALKLVDEEDRVLIDLTETDISNLKRTPINPEIWFLTESGFYTLALASRAPGVKPFRRWVTHDVLPTLRKTGRYEVAQLDELEVARRYVQALEAKKALESRVAELEPSANAWNVLGGTDADYAVREAAFILNRDPAIQIGQNRLFNLLRAWDLIDRKDIPYAAHEKHVRLRPQTRPDWETGERIKAKPQVRVTVEGLRYLHKRLGGTRPLATEPQKAA